MPVDKSTSKCFICGEERQYGPHEYQLIHVPRYDVWVCNICYQANWDGWARVNEERLIAHLQKEGLPIPQRNPQGWLPRD